MLNIVKLQDLIKNLPDGALRQALERPTGDIPAYLLLSEINRRDALRGEGAKAPAKSVADDLVDPATPPPAPPAVAASGQQMASPPPPPAPPAGAASGQQMASPPPPSTPVSAPVALARRGGAVRMWEGGPVGDVGGTADDQWSQTVPNPERPFDPLTADQRAAAHAAAADDLARRRATSGGVAAQQARQAQDAVESGRWSAPPEPPAPPTAPAPAAPPLAPPPAVTLARRGAAVPGGGAPATAPGEDTGAEGSPLAAFLKRIEAVRKENAAAAATDRIDPDTRKAEARAHALNTLFVGMMGTKNPNFLGGVGEAAKPALDSYQTALHELRTDETGRRKETLERQKEDLLALYHAGTISANEYHTRLAAAATMATAADATSARREAAVETAKRNVEKDYNDGYQHLSQRLTDATRANQFDPGALKRTEDAFGAEFERLRIVNEARRRSLGMPPLRQTEPPPSVPIVKS